MALSLSQTYTNICISVTNLLEHKFIFICFTNLLERECLMKICGSPDELWLVVVWVKEFMSSSSSFISICLMLQSCALHGEEGSLCLAMDTVVVFFSSVLNPIQMNEATISDKKWNETFWPFSLSLYASGNCDGFLHFRHMEGDDTISYQNETTAFWILLVWLSSLPLHGRNNHILSKWPNFLSSFRMASSLVLNGWSYHIRWIQY